MYFYYGLSNFYQNHRRYVKSRSDSQLLGDLRKGLEDCAPYTTADYKNASGSLVKDVPYAPCGAIANSFFNGECSLLGEMRNIKPVRGLL